MKPIVCGNWKMKLSLKESTTLTQQIAERANDFAKVDIRITPSFTAIDACSQIIQRAVPGKVMVGGQNVHWDDYQAATGEISVPLLKDAGATFALTGHSERRLQYGETNGDAAKRTLAALSKNFPIIFCIGETLAERESGATDSVLQAQLLPLVREISEEQINAGLILAYEPVWAIGTGKTATTKEIEQTHQSVFTIWSEQCQYACPPILYGGSVTPDNFKDIMAVPRVAGGLVGGASLKSDSFIKLLEIANSL